MTRALPRILLAAPKSGAGKTTVVCGLLQALVNRGMTPAAWAASSTVALETGNSRMSPSRPSSWK